MAAEPIRADHLVHDPLAGDESADLLRGKKDAERAEELALLRRKIDGIVVLIAGPANVALQLAWPEVGYGVVDSKVDSGKVTKHPFKRFRTTVGYLGVALLGSDEQRLAYRHAINGQHRQVRSSPDSPVKYNAFNRELQLWVASCIYYGTIDAFTRMHGPMTREEEAIVLRAGGRIGTTLQVPEDMWHRTPEEFWAYWEEGLERAHIDDHVRRYLLGLLQLRMVGGPLSKVVAPLHQWLNAGFIPEPVRSQLGLRWTDRDQRRHDRMLRVIGAISRPFPHVLRAFPINAMRLNLEVRRRFGRPMV